MKAAIILCLFGVAAIAVARPQQQYTDRYDTINLDQILANRRLLVPYLKCILDQGKCTPEGKELKSHIKEALSENCAKCTNAQRRGTNLVLEHLINNEPSYWDQLKAKYDPQSRFVGKYEQDFKKIH